MAANDEVVVTRDELHRLVVKCMVVSGADEENAKVMADLLVTADYRGHYSHGLNRLGKIAYVCTCLLVRTHLLYT